MDEMQMLPNGLRVKGRIRPSCTSTFLTWAFHLFVSVPASCIQGHILTLSLINQQIHPPLTLVGWNQDWTLAQAARVDHACLMGLLLGMGCFMKWFTISIAWWLIEFIHASRIDQSLKISQRRCYFCYTKSNKNEKTKCLHHAVL